MRPLCCTSRDGPRASASAPALAYLGTCWPPPISTLCARSASSAMWFPPGPRAPQHAGALLPGPKPRGRPGRHPGGNGRLPRALWRNGSGPHAGGLRDGKRRGSAPAFWSVIRTSGRRPAATGRTSKWNGKTSPCGKPSPPPWTRSPLSSSRPSTACSLSAWHRNASSPSARDAGRRRGPPRGHRGNGPRGL